MVDWSGSAVLAQHFATFFVTPRKLWHTTDYYCRIIDTAVIPILMSTDKTIAELVYNRVIVNSLIVERRKQSNPGVCGFCKQHKSVLKYTAKNNEGDEMLHMDSYCSKKVEKLAYLMTAVNTVDILPNHHDAIRRSIAIVEYAIEQCVMASSVTTNYRRNE
jgi:hypothetical protein